MIHYTQLTNWSLYIQYFNFIMYN